MSDYISSFFKNFLGSAPLWYKLTAILFLIGNPLIMYYYGPKAAGGALIAEFIFTLVMALKCYPLTVGGLLALEAIFMGLTSPAAVYHEVAGNVQVILLLIFMVTGIYFVKDLLAYIFTQVLLKVRSKIRLALLFCAFGAFLSSFLDALTVTAVVMSVAYAFYSIYQNAISDNEASQAQSKDMDEFRSFLRNLMMHAAVGTALGGICTLVGEPQNLLIGEKLGWTFAQFFFEVAPVSMPVLIVGFATCYFLEKKKLFSYGTELPASVRKIIEDYVLREVHERTVAQKTKLIIMSIGSLFVLVALAFHMAAVGLIGLAIIIFITSFTGIIDEQDIGKAFTGAMPFTALLMVFFSIVAVIHDQGLVKPLVHYALDLANKSAQLSAFYLLSGAISSISDNVFVATVYINEVYQYFTAGTISADHLGRIAVAINTGTNIPSIATPNGQAAFLFLLTSSLAPLIRLSYVRMVYMALPYTITMVLTGLVAIFILGLFI